ncbi:MAG: glycosyltransferase family 2 protein [Clostridia bacterium]|nr:glycosyltransferase family 2 protein [Clostridia bacterium]
MITIFTPTYNREKYVENIYKSLICQEDKGFIWLIIDDGSTDNTKNMIEKMQQKKEIKIEYYYQKNQGKHMAYNNAVTKCHTEYMICLDSDDILSSDAIKTLNENVKNISADIWALVGPRVHENGVLESNWNIKSNQKIKLQDIYQKCKYIGETYLLLNMKIVKNFLFPKFDDEKLVPENVIYDKMDDKYFVMTMDKKIYISDYQIDGYTQNEFRTFYNSIKGTCYSNLIKASSCSAKYSYKINAYARYLAIKKIFKVEERLFDEITVGISIKIGSTPFVIIQLVRNLIKKKKILKLKQEGKI